MSKSLYNSFKFIDMHYHADPDMYKRRYSALRAGRIYQRLNGAVVLRSHLGSTSVAATLAQQEGFPVFPSLSLNKNSGGLHYKNILKALAEYQPIIPSKLLVDFPTITGRSHRPRVKRLINNQKIHDQLSDGETIHNDLGKIKPEVYDVVTVAKDFPVILSTGHASREEVLDLIELCVASNVPLLINQPANPLTGLSAKELWDISKENNIWIEQTALTYILAYQSQTDFIEVIKTIPNLIYSSDLGQESLMDINEWLNTTQTWFNEGQITLYRRNEICLMNPLSLLKM